jgi:hypothetical protein
VDDPDELAVTDEEAAEFDDFSRSLPPDDDDEPQGRR